MEHYIGFLLCTIGYRYSWYLLQIWTNPSKSVGYAWMRTRYFYSSNILLYDNSIFLLQIAGCDSGTASIPESGVVVGAVAKAWRHFS